MPRSALFPNVLVRVEEIREMTLNPRRWPEIKALPTYREAVQATLPGKEFAESVGALIDESDPRAIKVYDMLIGEINGHIGTGVTSDVQATSIRFVLSTLGTVTRLYGSP